MFWSEKFSETAAFNKESTVFLETKCVCAKPFSPEANKLPQTNICIGFSEKALLIFSAKKEATLFCNKSEARAENC